MTGTSGACSVGIASSPFAIFFVLLAPRTIRLSGFRRPIQRLRQNETINWGILFKIPIFFSCARLGPLKENISRLPPCMLGRVFCNLFLHPCIAALKKPITFAKEFSGSKMLFSKSIFEFFVSVRARTWGEFCMATQFLAIFVFEASRSAR